MDTKYSYLTTLTENIVRRQQSSIAALKDLCHTTDMVSSDISILINDLQMIGNNQFAENRINDDDITSATTASESYSQQKDLSSYDSHIERQTSTDLKLSSLLSKAFELVPEDTTNQVSDFQYQVNENEQSASIGSESHDDITDAAKQLSVAAEPIIDVSAEAVQDVNTTTLVHSNYVRADALRVVKSPKDANEVDLVVDDGKADVKDLDADPYESRIHQHHDNQQHNRNLNTRVEPPSIGSMNKDRVANILKRYSLYDDDEEEE